jgi:hypothetical protein
MTGEAEPVDRLVQLTGILTIVGIVAGFAHTGGNRAMKKLERFELTLLIFMTVIAEL